MPGINHPSVTLSVCPFSTEACALANHPDSRDLDAPTWSLHRRKSCWARGNQRGLGPHTKATASSARSSLSRRRSHRAGGPRLLRASSSTSRSVPMSSTGEVPHKCPPDSGEPHVSGREGRGDRLLRVRWGTALAPDPEADEDRDPRRGWQSCGCSARRVLLQNRAAVASPCRPTCQASAGPLSSLTGPGARPRRAPDPERINECPAIVCGVPVRMFGEYAGALAENLSRPRKLSKIGTGFRQSKITF